MIIRLTDLDAHYINLESKVERNDNTKNVLNDIGFKRVKRSPGFVSVDNVTGCSLAHRNVLLSIPASKYPFLLFEDDIEVKNFIDIIDIPEDADAVYLGISKMGVVNDEVVEEIWVSEASGYNNLFKIHNMLAAHAILYINKDYVDEINDSINCYVDSRVPHDVLLAKEMTNWNVYAYIDPMFIQSKKFRDYTDKKISDLDGLVFI
jgi:hypothetical protein